MKFLRLTLISLCFFTTIKTLPAQENKSVSAIEIIRAGLGDSDIEIRGLSAGIIGQIGDKDSAGKLLGLLNDANDSVKIRAAVSLYRLGNKSGIVVIRKILGSAPKLSENPTTLERARAIAKGTKRVEAAAALGEIRDFDSMILLKKMVRDSDGRVADASLVALARLGDTSAKKEFLSALESVKQGVRAKAAEALGEIGDSDSVPFLRKKLKDWDRDVKVSAITALAKLNDKESAVQIKELLRDSEEIVREKSAAALGMLGSPGSVEDLKKALSDTSGFVRIQVAGALHSFGDDSGKDFLIKVLKTAEKEARLKAIAVFENMAGAGDTEILNYLLADSDKSIAINAAKIAYKIKMLKR